MLESLFNKVAGAQACNYIKKRLQHRPFPVNIAKFLRTAFFYRTPPQAAAAALELRRLRMRSLPITCFNSLVTNMY